MRGPAREGFPSPRRGSGPQVQKPEKSAAARVSSEGGRTARYTDRQWWGAQGLTAGEALRWQAHSRAPEGHRGLPSHLPTLSRSAFSPSDTLTLKVGNEQYVLGVSEGDRALMLSPQVTPWDPAHRTHLPLRGDNSGIESRAPCPYGNGHNWISRTHAVSVTTWMFGDTTGKKTMQEPAGDGCGAYKSDRGLLKSQQCPRQKFGTNFFLGILLWEEYH